MSYGKGWGALCVNSKEENVGVTFIQVTTIRISNFFGYFILFVVVCCWKIKGQKWMIYSGSRFHFHLVSVAARTKRRVEARNFSAEWYRRNIIWDFSDEHETARTFFICRYPTLSWNFFRLFHSSKPIQNCSRLSLKLSRI